jgi:hypothetical protein
LESVEIYGLYAYKSGLCFLLYKIRKGCVFVVGFSSCYLQRVVLGRGGGGRKVWTLLERRTMMNGVEKTNGEDVATEEQLITPWTVSVAR